MKNWISALLCLIFTSSLSAATLHINGKAYQLGVRVDDRGELAEVYEATDSEGNIYYIKFFKKQGLFEDERKFNPVKMLAEDAQDFVSAFELVPSGKSIIYVHASNESGPPYPEFHEGIAISKKAGVKLSRYTDEFAIFTKDEGLLTVVTRLDGKDLKKLDPQQITDRLEFNIQIARRLFELWATKATRNISHKDVKPGNLVIDFSHDGKAELKSIDNGGMRVMQGGQEYPSSGPPPAHTKQFASHEVVFDKRGEFTIFDDLHSYAITALTSICQNCTVDDIPDVLKMLNNEKLLEPLGKFAKENLAILRDLLQQAEPISGSRNVIYRLRTYEERYATYVDSSLQKLVKVSGRHPRIRAAKQNLTIARYLRPSPELFRDLKSRYGQSVACPQVRSNVKDSQTPTEQGPVQQFKPEDIPTEQQSGPPK